VDLKEEQRWNRDRGGIERRTEVDLKEEQRWNRRQRWN
jgi:hypothetical protein